MTICKTIVPVFTAVIVIFCVDICVGQRGLLSRHGAIIGPVLANLVLDHRLRRWSGVGRSMHGVC